jgi:hypothetical protein
MSLINNQYFRGELIIPNLNGTGPVYESRSRSMEEFIAIHEADYLMNILTMFLYDAFMAGISADSPLEKWTALKAKLINETLQTSPIANYVYYQYQISKLTDSTTIGETKGVPENATQELNTLKLVRAWNRMVDASDVIWQWLIDNADTYPEFDLDADFPFVKVNRFGI